MYARNEIVTLTDEDQWFESLWAEYAGLIYSYAARRVGPDAAPDVVADTFAIAWRKRGKVPLSVLPWLYGVARKVISQHHRGEVRYVRLQERAGGQVVVYDASIEGRVADKEILEQALRSLNDTDLEVLRLVAWEGLSHSEAAMVMGYSEGSFRVRLSRARRRLKKEIEARGGTSDE